MMSLAPELQEVIDRWSADQYVDPGLLQMAVGRLQDITKNHADELPEGEIIYLANLAGVMNRDLEKMETRRILRREGADSV